MKKYSVILLCIVLVALLCACTAPTELPADDTAQKTEITGTNDAQDTASAYTADTTDVSESPALSDTTDAEPSLTDTTELISRERAVEIALQAAGLTQDDVFDIDAELERERGEVIWEVDFETRDYEYSYYIDAENGSVIRNEKEIND